MLHAIIIDDEVNGVKSLELLIKKYISEIKVVATTTLAVEGIQLINDYRPDVVFLDISMPVLNGFEILEKLEFRNFDLIYTTAHREYGLKALKSDAADYLLKPVGVEDLRDAVKRIIKIRNKFNHGETLKNILSEIVKTPKIKVPLSSKDTIEYVTPSQIVYLEADSNSSIVVFSDSESLKTNKSLKEYESILCKENSNFIRIHNSYIININFITRYTKEDGGYAVMQGKKSIPISKNKKEDFLKAINFNSKPLS